MLINIDKTSEIPLLGCIAFGIIDRGTNILQVRPTSVCNLKCQFCSTSANNPDLHPNTFMVNINYLLEYVKKAVEFKGKDTQIFIDSVGDPMTHPKIIELINKLSKIKNISKISMVTNGTLITNKIKDLEKAGLSEINISLHSLNQEQAKTLMGNPTYKLEKVINNLKELSKTKIKLVLTPVYLPKVNDQEIPRILNLAKELNCSLGIQKYDVYKFSRKLKQAKNITYFKFYKKLEDWEKINNQKLKLTKQDINLEKRESFPIKLEKGKTYKATIKCNGWLKNQQIAVSNNRVVSVLDSHNKINDKINIKVLENKNNLYIAKRV
tara:strand:+ start:2086 stop:3057 length:972 start_codon:yes stop_codon:yes gene_type:complete